jgi:hypothetical protein
MSDPYTSPAGADIDPSSVAYIGRVTFNAKPDHKLIKIARRVDTRDLLYEDAAVTEEGTWDFKNPDLAMMKRNDKRTMHNQRVGMEPIVISSVSGVMKREGGNGGGRGGSVEARNAQRMNAMENYTLAGIVQGPVTVHKENATSQVVRKALRFYFFKKILIFSIGFDHMRRVAVDCQLQQPNSSRRRLRVLGLAQAHGRWPCRQERLCDSSVLQNE